MKTGGWQGGFMGGLLWLLAATAFAEELVVVGSRQPYLIQPIFDAFQTETGIRIDYRYFEAKALLGHLQSMGDRSPADLLLTADVGMMAEMLDADLLQPVSSPILSTLIPPPFRDDRNRWFGFSLRARVIFYSPERFQPAAGFSYGDLASPQFRGRLCMRSSGHVYNQSFIAALVEHWGMEKTQEWAKGIAANLARPPTGGDQDQIRAVASGECDLTIANTYYYAGMLGGSPEQRAVVEKVALLWPDHSGMGVHVNISVGAVLKLSKHPQFAVKFLEFLAGSHVQHLFAALNYEYPIVTGIPVSDRLLNMGPFKADSLPLTRLYQNRNIIKALTEVAFP